MSWRSGTIFLGIALSIYVAQTQPARPGDSIGGGTAGCTNPSCPDPPCAASTLGDVGCTTVAGVEEYDHELLKAGDTIPVGSHIFGPFEAGFTSKQDSIIENWGCSDPSVVYDAEGGRDIGIATMEVAKECNVEFPRIEGSTYYGVVGYCGGHTADYHFHQSFSCLYEMTGSHSTAVGDIASYKMYGKWEDYDNSMLPYLDACGGHFGPTPESPDERVYHYHVQDKAPYTIGCHGPAANGGLVSVQQCRDLYDHCDGIEETFTNTDGTIYYFDRYCPCYDANGRSVGDITELPALSTTEISYSATGGTTTPSSDSGANALLGISFSLVFCGMLMAFW